MFQFQYSKTNQHNVYFTTTSFFMLSSKFRIYLFPRIKSYVYVCSSNFGKVVLKILVSLNDEYTTTTKFIIKKKHFLATSSSSALYMKYLYIISNHNIFGRHRKVHYKISRMLNRLNQKKKKKIFARRTDKTNEIKHHQKVSVSQRVRYTKFTLPSVYVCEKYLYFVFHVQSY